MTKIFKYELDVVNSQNVEGNDLVPLSVGIQDGKLVLWATVDNDEDWCLREIVIYGTGHEWTHNIEDLEFLGTVQQGELVWHIYAVVGG